MEQLLQHLLKQNAVMLDRLVNIESKLGEIADSVDEYSSGSSASSVIEKITEIVEALDWTNKASTAGQIIGELSWTNENSIAERLLTTLESIKTEIHDLKK